MNHIDPDQLAALALDPDAGEGDDADHLAECVRCRRELATLREVTARARRAGPSEPPSVPPEAVWDSVVQELSASGGLGPGQVPPRVRWQPWAVVAAAVVVVVLTAAALLPLTGSQVVAEATLEPLADVAQVRAELLTDDDVRMLQIDELNLPAIDGYYELWLMTRQGDGLVSLGPVTDRVNVVVPDVIDVREFSVVDVSREPFDGDPAHSTDSVLRGPLEPASGT